jgi:hypothetical protein
MEHSRVDCLPRLLGGFRIVILDDDACEALEPTDEVVSQRPRNVRARLDVRYAILAHVRRQRGLPRRACVNGHAARDQALQALGGRLALAASGCSRSTRTERVPRRPQGTPF